MTGLVVLYDCSCLMVEEFVVDMANSSSSDATS